ncbi:MAG TPA: phosphatase PAP2 family protein [Sediminibacterium sp.]|nr:phosphatase PAP2 family protein [Sediminibacterium sp.]
MLSIFLLNSYFDQLWERARDWDMRLFVSINSSWTNKWVDSVYPWWRDANTWIPFYLFLIVFALVNFGRKAYAWIGFAVLTVALTDQISSNFLKKWIQRPRPCQDPEMAGHVRLLLDHCSGGFSFPSSHATNHFGFAMFLFLTLRPWMKKWGYLLFLWAATIAYGQVYVGVHYPIDISFGSLLGCFLGWVTARLYRYFFQSPFESLPAQS